MNKGYVINLQDNFPMQKAQDNELNMKEKSRFENLNKIYSDSSRYLSINCQNTITFPVTRMDILFWKNLKEDLNARHDLICDNMNLS